MSTFVKEDGKPGRWVLTQAEKDNNSISFLQSENDMLSSMKNSYVKTYLPIIKREQTWLRYPEKGPAGTLDNLFMMLFELTEAETKMSIEDGLVEIVVDANRRVIESEDGPGDFWKMEKQGLRYLWDASTPTKRRMARNLETRRFPFKPCSPEDISPGPERDQRQISRICGAWGSCFHYIMEYVACLSAIEEQKSYERYPPENPARSMESLIQGLFGFSMAGAKEQAEKHIANKYRKPKTNPINARQETHTLAQAKQTSMF